MILGNIAANYISNAVFTKDQEKEADSLGFQYLVEAGYNPGGAAASMSVLLTSMEINQEQVLRALSLRLTIHPQGNV